MNKEKLLYFLDIKTAEEFNKNTGKGVLILDILFSFFIIGLGLLFKCISNSVFDIVCVCLTFLTAIVFYAWYKIAKASITNVTYTSSILFISSLKLLYGYWIFAKGEMRDYGYAVFSWAHATVAIVAFVGVIFIASLYVKLYKDIKKMSMQELLDRENRTIIKANEILRKHKWLMLLPALLPTPYIGSKIFDVLTIGMGLGVGFGMWTLFCVWILITSMYFPKLIVYVMYRQLAKS